MSTHKHSSNTEQAQPQKLRHERPKGKSFEQTALFVLGLLAAVMLGISLFTLNTETGPLANLKVLLITVSASFAAYGINKVSVEKLAPRAALGFRLAAFVAITGMSVSGTGMFIGSFSGMVYRDIQLRVLEEAGQDQSAFIQSVNDTSLLAERISPIAHSIAEEVTRTAGCEVSESCLSRQGDGGRGEIAIALEGRAQQAQSIADALDRGAFERQQILENLNALNGRYQQILADTDQGIMQRRANLQGLHAEIQQAASALREALPLPLLAGFADELHAGTVVPGNAAGSQRLNGFLRGLGDQLRDALRDIPQIELTPPPFPARPGMLDSLRFIADFAAVAAVIAIAELCLPMALFVIAYLTLVWEIEKRSPSRDETDYDDPDFDGLIDLPPVPTRANGAQDTRQDQAAPSRGRS